MPTVVEKKFRVSTFEPILAYIQQCHIPSTLEVRTTHYYAQLPTEDTLKIINYGDRVEIHRLTTTHGLHSLDEVIPLQSVEDGLQWFHARGYDKLDVLAMHDREFEFKGGGFALYTINNTVCSIILGYPEEDLASMEQALGLQSAEVISVPYNKYLAQLGMVQTIPTARSGE